MEWIACSEAITTLCLYWITREYVILASQPWRVTSTECEGSMSLCSANRDAISPLSEEMHCVYWVFICFTSWQQYLRYIYHGGDAMYEMRRRKPKPTRLPTQWIFNLPDHICMVWEELAFDDAVSYKPQWWKSKLAEMMAWGIEWSTFLLGVRLRKKSDTLL